MSFSRDANEPQTPSVMSLRQCPLLVLTETADGVRNPSQQVPQLAFGTSGRQTPAVFSGRHYPEGDGLKEKETK